MYIIGSALKEYPPPSMREIARRLGMKQVLQLRKQFPKQYHLLLKRKTEFGRLKWISIYENIEKTWDENPPPSLHEISKRLKGISTNAIAKRRPDLIRRVKDRRIEYRNKHCGHFKSALEEALNEIPPPSISRVAERVGLKCSGSLTMLFPELCLQLKAQRSRATISRHRSTESLLRAALREMPPSSIIKISERLKIGITCLYKKYPTIIKAITLRYAKYRRNVSINRKKKLKVKVKQAVLHVLRKGQFPSSKRVAEVLKSQSGAGEKAIRAPLKAIKVELNLC
jgi:hypothetical protein